MKKREIILWNKNWRTKKPEYLGHEKVRMHFWTFALNRSCSLPTSRRRVKNHETSWKYKSSPALLQTQMFIDKMLLHCQVDKPTQPAGVKRRGWREDVFFSFWFWRGAFSEVLDPWTGSAVLNILSTVCLPRADLPDMLSSWLAGDATSLRISPATREAPLHFLWINSHTVGEEERPGHRGTGTEMRRKHTHIHTHSFSKEQHTQPWLQYELPWSEPDESSESIQWIETAWNLYFNYSFTAHEVCFKKTVHS